MSMADHPEATRSPLGAAWERRSWPIIVTRMFSRGLCGSLAGRVVGELHEIVESVSGRVGS